MIRYRKDIQILRGLAVLLVVFFHLQAPGFRGGFLGVDIFFVISGYLMAVMYDPSEKLAFLEKRALRLLPAYFVTIAATLLAAAFITTPNDFSKVVDQAWFGAFFASNIGFWMENSYFDKSSFKPLLHLWSLGVEIQFYLLVPLVANLGRRSRIGFAVLASASAALCFVTAALTPSTAFYLLPFRLWEFLLGFGIVMFGGLDKPSNDPRARRLRWMALATVCIVPLVGIDGTASGFIFGHPGLAALLVCIATATLLKFGMPLPVEQNWTGTVLERLGAYSYSVYLAHFPIIVLVLYRPFSGTVLQAPNAGTTAWVALLIMIVSALLFHFVERPWRQGHRVILGSATLAMTIVVMTPLAVQLQSGLFPEKERLIYAASFDREEFRCGKFYSLLHRGEVSCDLTPELDRAEEQVLLVGNSHADAIKSTFLSVARQRGIGVRFVVQNTVLMPGGRVGVSELVHEAVERRTTAIVLHYSPGAVPPETIKALVDRTAPLGIRVALLLPIPVWQQSVPGMLIRSLKQGAPLPVITAASYREPNIPFERAIERLAASRIRVYRTDQAFCQPVCRVIASNGKPFYFDDAHLTLTGSEQLRPVFERILDDLRR